MTGTARALLFCAVLVVLSTGCGSDRDGSADTTLDTCVPACGTSMTSVAFANDILGAEPSRLQHREQVGQALTSLIADPTLDQGSGDRIDRRLTGTEDEIARHDGVAVWADGHTRGTDDRFPHSVPFSGEAPEVNGRATGPSVPAHGTQSCPLSTRLDKRHPGPTSPVVVSCPGGLGQDRDGARSISCREAEPVSSTGGRTVAGSVNRKMLLRTQAAMIAAKRTMWCSTVGDRRGCSAAGLVPGFEDRMESASP